MDCERQLDGQDHAPTDQQPPRQTEVEPISARHRPSNPNMAQSTPTRHEHANATQTNTPNTGSMPIMGDSDTARATGHW